MRLFLQGCAFKHLTSHFSGPGDRRAAPALRAPCCPSSALRLSWQLLVQSPPPTGRTQRSPYPSQGSQRLGVLTDRPLAVASFPRLTGAQTTKGTSLPSQGIPHAESFCSLITKYLEMPCVKGSCTFQAACQTWGRNRNACHLRV